MDVCCWGGKPGLRCKASILLRSSSPKSFVGFGFLYCLILFALISIIVVGCTYTCVRPTIVWRSENTLHWFFLPLGVPGSNLGHQASMAGTFTCWALLLAWIFIFCFVSVLFWFGFGLVHLVWGIFVFSFEIVPQDDLELKMSPRMACGWTLASVAWVQD